MSGGGSPKGSPTRPTAIVITCWNFRYTEVGAAPPRGAEVAETGEMLSSSSDGEAFVSVGVMNDNGVGHLRVAVSTLLMTSSVVALTVRGRYEN